MQESRPVEVGFSFLVTSILKYGVFGRSWYYAGSEWAGTVVFVRVCSDQLVENEIMVML